MRLLIAISMMQFILGPVEVTNIAGDRFEVSCGTVAEIRAALSVQLGIEQWSIFVLQGTEILDDEETVIEDGATLTMVCSDKPERFIRWILERNPEITVLKEQPILPVTITHKKTDKGSMLNVEIDYSRAYASEGPKLLNVSYSANFPVNLVRLPQLLDDKFIMTKLMHISSLTDEQRQNYLESLYEQYKDDATMLATIEFINQGFITNRYRVYIHRSTKKEIRCLFARVDRFLAMIRLMEILMNS